MWPRREEYNREESNIGLEKTQKAATGRRDSAPCGFGQPRRGLLDALIAGSTARS